MRNQHSELFYCRPIPIVRLPVRLPVCDVSGY